MLLKTANLKCKDAADLKGILKEIEKRSWIIIEKCINSRPESACTNVADIRGGKWF